MQKILDEILEANRTSAPFSLSNELKKEIIGVSEFSVPDLTCSVLAGTKFSEFQNELSEANQFFPLISPKDSTIGGLVAGNFRGFYQKKYGSFRDNILGLKFITGSGKVAKAGGKVVKNVAGYETIKLLIGSYGTLAILTEITLRTYAKPQTESLLIFENSELSEILKVANFCRNEFLPCDTLEITNEDSFKLYCGFSGMTEEVQNFVEILKDKFSKDLIEEIGKSLNKRKMLSELTDKFYTDNFAFKIITSVTNSKKMLGRISESFRLDFLTGTFLVISENINYEKFVSLKKEFKYNLKKSRFSNELLLPRNKSTPEQNLILNLKQKFDPNGILNPTSIL
ncbi:MAG: FAD-binding oxidoreductase [Calditrichaeota bacterium]|nr:MAG: FAD-binding oxidoreductase [Calditrichota bacterium]